jgi:Domain of unknown function (DUF4126)
VAQIWNTIGVETLLILMLGISLSAACGFRIFMPPFVMSLMAQYGGFDLPANLEWMHSPLATTAFGIATGAEIFAYYIPWFDHLLDTLATPAAAIAGTLMTGAFVDLDPATKWTLAVIAGGGAATGIQMLTNVTRLASTATTGGLANPVVATTEHIASTGLSLLAIFVPIIAIALVVLLLGFAVSRILRFRRRQAV